MSSNHQQYSSWNISLFYYSMSSCQGTKYVSGHKRVWAQMYMFLPRHDCDHMIITCLGTIVSGHNRIWAQSCLGTIVSGNNRVWAQSYLGTIVSGHNRVWAQSCGLKYVWAQSCGLRRYPFTVVFYQCYQYQPFLWYRCLHYEILKSFIPIN